MEDEKVGAGKVFLIGIYFEDFDVVSNQKNKDERANKKSGRNLRPLTKSKRRKYRWSWLI